MDRRVIWAIALMMLIALAPTFLGRKTVKTDGTVANGMVGTVETVGSDSQVASTDSSVPALQADSSNPTAPTVPTIPTIVRSPLYTYEVSPVGGAIVSATLNEYRSMAEGDSGSAQIIRRGDRVLGLSLVAGRDTLALDTWTFQPSATSLSVTGPTPLTLTGSRNGVTVELTYLFTPDYRVAVTGRVSGLAPEGALALVEMGRGLLNTEADSGQNYGAYALVVKDGGEAERTDFRSLDAGESRVLPGPFEWAAVKSKYFAASLFALDSAAGRGRISGVRATAPAAERKYENEVDVTVTLPVPASGALAYSAYLGPLEYERLAAIGHDFDDVNPYGWPGFRTLVRFFAVPVRWLLVQLHDNLHMAWGVALIAFGVLLRILLWPLNQKAMRANMKMQEMQPHLKAAQERYKDDPPKLQQEMFRLYKEYGVNPMSGCWPMLLPMPILFALFFVFQNAIELRGQSFLWLPDLSRPDPLYIIPLLMGASMYVLSKVGMAGMPPNPQATMMLYIMPVMMTVLFLNFASGLNLYYAVSNIASIPQQWLLARERKKRAARAIVDVRTKAPAKPPPKPPKPKK
jgi:YidC/Oxa1 family membrane protein insertase